MSSAVGLYRLHLAIAVGGAHGVLLAFVVALDAAASHEEAPVVLVATVLTSRSVIVVAEASVLLALGAIVMSSFGLGLRAAWIEYRTHRRVSRALAAGGAVGVTDGVHVIEDGRLLAFCHGLLRPRIYVSRGVLDALAASELAALLAHERHHAGRRDPLRLAVARVLGGLLFFLPVLPRLLARYVEEAELAADEAALRDGRDVAALASALLAFSDRGAGLHPGRIDHLLGKRPEARVPTGSMLSAAAIIVMLTVLGLAGATGNGHRFLVVASPALFVGTGLAVAALLGPAGLLHPRAMRTPAP